MNCNSCRTRKYLVLEERMVQLEKFTDINCHLFPTIAETYFSFHQISPLSQSLVTLNQFAHILQLEDILPHNLLYSHFISDCHKQILSPSKQRHIKDIALNHKEVSLSLTGNINTNTSGRL
jgi:hypothetical protein